MRRLPECRRCRWCSPRGSSSRRRRPPGPRTRQAPRSSGTTLLISRSAGIVPSATSATAFSKSERSYNRAPMRVSSRQKKRCRFTSRGRGWIATRHSRPRTPSTSTAVSTPPAAPDTSKATSAPASPVHSRTSAGHILVGRVPRRQPQLLGQQPTVRAQLHHPHLGARGPRHQRDQDADRPAADHHDLLAPGDLGAAHVVHGHRRRLDQRGPVQRKSVGQPDQGGGGHGPALLHRTRRVDADEVQVLADVLMPRTAGRAGVVPAQRHHRDRVTGPPALHPRPDPHHPAGHLMPQDGGRTHPGIHVAVEDMQIGTADTDKGGSQLHLTRARSRSIRREPCPECGRKRNGRRVSSGRQGPFSADADGQQQVGVGTGVGGDDRQRQVG